jgi:DNA-directed RNA polymerase specialized sigma24 family protein
MADLEQWLAIRDLGQVPDRVIAKRMGVHLDTVTRNRNALGIPAFARTRGAIDPDDLTGVEGLSLAQAAEVLGVDETTVSRARRRAKKLVDSSAVTPAK